MTDWRALTTDGGLVLDPEHDDTIVVTFRDGRSQRVRVAGPANGVLRAWSTVLPDTRSRDRGTLAQRACVRNATVDLVGFKLDSDGHLIGEAWIPVAGLDAAEWGELIRHVGRACDRFEHALTGADAR